MIEAAGVIVPVHDEEVHLESCLASVGRALATLSGIPNVTAVVLDTCSDLSEAIARRWARGARPGETRLCIVDRLTNVGRARAVGVRAVLKSLARHHPSTIWLSTTDADSTVPSTWLGDQVSLAQAGIQAIAGTIEVRDWIGYPPSMRDQFHRFYSYSPPGEGDAHTHVHGANMGFRADAYLAAGGFESRRTGEDHALWQALHRTSRPRVASRKIVVVTSSRRHARAPAGFSSFLGRLSQEFAK